jgi:hypothetical protein
MRSFKDLSFGGLALRGIVAWLLAAVGLAVAGYGDTQGVLWMTIIGFVVLVPGAVVFVLCVYHAVAGPLQLGRPLPPRRDDSRATPEDYDAERRELQAAMRAGARRMFLVLPVFLAGVVLMVLGQELPNDTLSAVAPWLLGAGFVLGLLVSASSTVPVMGRLWRR